MKSVLCVCKYKCESMVVCMILMLVFMCMILHCFIFKNTHNGVCFGETVTTSHTLFACSSD